MKQSSYYKFVPLHVMYDKRLSANAKLLYVELTSTLSDKGYCVETNRNLANVFNVSTSIVSVWLRQLKELGYIKIKLIYIDSSKEIKERRIFIN